MTERRQASPAVASLFTRALEASDGDERADVLAQLHKLGTRAVFDYAVEMTRSSSSEERAVAAAVLGQVDAGHAWSGPVPGESVAALLALGEREADPEVLESVGNALGHRGDPRAVPLLQRLAEHPDARVRESAAFALPPMVDESRDVVPAVVQTLLGLTRDPDPDVRSWALSGIGSGLSEEDGAEIRAALAEALGESEAEARAEAILGLALRNDPRALPAIKDEIAREPHHLVFRAVAALHDASLLPAVLELPEPADPVAAHARRAAIASLRDAAASDTEGSG
jgi:HEAT repeat protein